MLDTIGISPGKTLNTVFMHVQEMKRNQGWNEASANIEWAS